MSMVNAVPMQCSTCTVRASAGGVMSQPRSVERALQRAEVAVAGVGRAADGIDLRALRGQRLLVQLRDGIGVDLLVPRVVDRVLDGVDRGNRAVLHGDLHLDRTVLG